MKITINTIPLLAPATGVGNYAYNVAATLKSIDTANAYVYFYGHYSDKFYPKMCTENNSTSEPSRALNPMSLMRTKRAVKKMPIARDIARWCINKYFDLNINLAETLNKYGRCDVYFEPNFIPLQIRSKRVVATIHDFAFIHHPEWLPNDRRRYFNANFKTSIKRADKIIVPSEFVKKEALGYLGVPEDMVRAIHHGINTDIFRRYDESELKLLKVKHDLPENFILYVGSIEPRKNLERLLSAYRMLESGTRKDVKLVLAGFEGWKNKKVLRLIKKFEKDVVFLGYLPDAEIAMLYNLATLFIFPSFYEGFGMPPTEAMACGCPVLVSNTASLPEVCQDAAKYFDPHDPEDIAEGISTLLSDDALRDALSIKGLKRAEAFKWKRSALEHLEIFKGL
jgi:glycosyltransferase involved in cell wall biosynthesis